MQQTSGHEQNPSATEAVRSAASDAAALLKTELTLAKRELTDNMRAMRGSTLALGGAAVLGLAGMELLLGSVIVAGRKQPEVLERTRRRASEDTSEIAGSLR